MTDLKYETGRVDTNIAHAGLNPGLDLHEAIRKRLTRAKRAAPIRRAAMPTSSAASFGIARNRSTT